MTIRLCELGVPLYDEESPAAQQAKQMGLQYRGFGNWADPRTGQITHRTDNQRLVPVDQQSDPTQVTRRPRRPRRPNAQPKEPKPEQSTIPVNNTETKKDPTFDELRDAARKHQYTIMTENRIEKFRSVPESEQRVEYKPKGIWFGVRDSWVDWTEREMPEWKGDNLYSVEVDEDKCLVINTLEELTEFHNTYKTNTPYGEKINWSIVADQYSGIIIKKYFWKARMKYIWYYTWDVASGCVWDSTAIKGIDQVPIK